jgi:hypothetical protein
MMGGSSFVAIVSEKIIEAEVSNHLVYISSWRFCCFYTCHPPASKSKPDTFLSYNGDKN